MGHYLIRKAEIKDIQFLTEVVIAAEKSNSDKLSYSTLFNLAEKKVKELIRAMFEEEIDGCDFSLSSFCVAEYNGEAIGGFGGWIEEFEAAARRPLAQRMKYAFIKTYKPVLDDEPYRSFETMEEYRTWCDENLPKWLGYGRV